MKGLVFVLMIAMAVLVSPVAVIACDLCDGPPVLEGALGSWSDIVLEREVSGAGVERLAPTGGLIVVNEIIDLEGGYMTAMGHSDIVERTGAAIAWTGGVATFALG